MLPKEMDNGKKELNSVMFLYFQSGHTVVQSVEKPLKVHQG